MKFKDIFNRFKYGPLKRKGMTAVSVGYIGVDSKKKGFDEKVDILSKSISPCYKANVQVLDYLKQKYVLKEKVLTEGEKENYKINFLLGRHPKLLNTPEIDLQGKVPNKKDLLKISEQNEKRFSEARNYPLEKLGLEIEAYTFEHILSDGFKVVFQVTAENKYDDISAVFSVINRELSLEEQLELKKISDEVTLFKGVKKEDIEKRTPEFIRFVAAWETKGK